MPDTTRRALLFAAAATPAAAMLAPSAALAGEGAAKADSNFFVLGDFTVNVPGRRRGYLVLSVTVEATPGKSEGLRDISPRIQDAVLRRLMAMSEQGVLQPNSTDPLTIKDALFETITKLRPESVKDVLLTRILYS